jgi:multidrug resistance efflux pump
MKQLGFLIFFLAVGIGLAGCQASPLASSVAAVDATKASAILPPVAGKAGIRVEGKLVPNEYVNLSFNMGGMVVEVLAQEGQTVAAGQVIARLDQRERLASAVAAAELEVVLARQAVKDLQENASVVSAAALQKVTDGRDALRDAERYLNNLNKGARSTDIDQARADVVLLKDRLDKALEDFAPYKNKPEDNVERASYLSRLADAQRKYDDAVRFSNNLQGQPAEIDLAIAEANLLLAQAQLQLAELEYEDVKTGPDPDDKQAAQARLVAAESALTAAQASLADSELVAPFAGAIVKLDLKAGEQTGPGQPAVTLADFSRWKVETDDLNEMDIPRVSEGMAVVITPDALPDLELAGQVETISQLAVEKFGDVTYTAKIVLQESDPRLRWGMTVSVHFNP